MTDNLQPASPPIAELWIAFTFSGSERAWKLESIRDFFAIVGDRYEDAEAFSRKTSAKRLSKVTSGPAEKEVLPEAVFGRGKDGTSAIQLRDSGVSIHFVAEDDFPGFAALAEKALVELAAYAKFFGVTQLESVVLHCTNLVEFELEDGRSLNLSNFFTVLPTWPKAFGYVRDFRIQCLLGRDVPADRFFLDFRSIESSDEKANFRLDFEWRSTVSEKIDLVSVRDTLDSGWKRLEDAFYETLTKKALKQYPRAG